MVGKKTTYLILFLILIAALGSRLIGLTQNPPGLNWDEVSHGYNAYSLLLTGRDQWNQPFPITNFRAYGDYPTTLNLYTTVPSIALFGPSDFALRLPHALIGVLTVLVGYIAIVRWKRQRLLGLVTAVVFAFSPWTFFLSRQVLQANWTIFLLTLGLALYISRFFYLTTLVWGLSLFAYHNTRIFLPIFLISLLFKRSVRTDRKQSLLIIILILISALVLWSSQSRARGNWVGIIDQGAVAYIEKMRNLSTLPPYLSRLVYNRPVYMLTNSLQNYFGYFSPQFLFISGGTQYQFSLPGFGVLQPVFLPFFYLGLLILLIRREWLILSWLILSPIPAAITRDQYAVVRATTMLPAVFFTISLAIFWLYKKLSPFLRWTYLFLILGLFGYFSFLYFNSYIYRYPWLYSQSWQSANKPLVEMARKLFPEYDRIIITKRYGEPHEFVLWYWPYHPGAYQTEPGKVWDFHDQWYWVDGFSKFMFVNDWELADVVKNLTPGNRYLVFSSADSQPAGAKIGQINFLDGTPAYIVKAL